MKTDKTPKTRAQLKREILELKSQLAHVYHFADHTLNKAGGKYMMGSGVLLQLTAIGGEEIINPIMIKDGLSEETIAAIRADIIKSYELSTMFKPTINPSVK